jgi:hypothetical protein
LNKVCIYYNNIVPWQLQHWIYYYKKCWNFQKISFKGKSFLNIQFLKKHWHWNVELAVVLAEKMHWVPIRLKNGSRSLGQRCILLRMYWPSILQKFYVFPRNYWPSILQKFYVFPCKVPKFPTKWANHETWKIQLVLG